MPEKKPLDNLVAKFERHVTDLKEEFSDLLAEMTKRFGKRNDDEIFRAFPKPQPLDVPLETVLMNRRSERSFSDEPVTDYDLASVLFAADGINRPNGKRTTPSAFNWREIDIYVLKANGIWRWIPERNGLLFLTLQDVRSLSTIGQPTILGAPVQLVYVANYGKTRGRMETIGEKLIEIFRDDWDEKRMQEVRRQAATLNVGAKVEAVYLAAAALKLATVVRLGFDPDKLGKALHLGEDEEVIAVQSLGYRPTSLFDHFR